MEYPVSFAGLDLAPPDRYLLPAGSVEQPSSVGLVCVCGKAVATIAGTTASCGGGRVWIVSALRIAGP